MERLALVLRVGLAAALLSLAASCSGGGRAGGADTDGGGGGATGAPAGWTCDPNAYGDGIACHCECGIPDPDCASGKLIVSGCVNNQVCSPEGTCSDCGDGEVEPGEACDSALHATTDCAAVGYQPGQVPCKASCEWAYEQCKPLDTCGNGKLDPGELCDGPDIKADLDCTDYGRASGTLSCTAGCRIDTTACYTCGDGRIEGPEQCDDHNPNGGDGCSATCAPEPGWQCTGNPIRCTPICGDGRRVGDETCDDGNLAGNDGCSPTCRTEQDCSCTGTPSTCTCAALQTIINTVQRIDTAALVLDDAGQPQVIYFYGTNFTDGNGVPKEQGHEVYATRPGGTWTTTDIDTWTQPQAILGPEDIELSNDGGILHAYYQRFDDPAGSFASATRGAFGWQVAYDKQSFAYDTVRAGGNWHSLVTPSGFGSLSYYMGAPGAWLRNEPLTGLNVSNTNRIAAASNDDVYISQAIPGNRHTSFNMKLTKRVDATTWSTVYDVATTGDCVFPVAHELLPLPGGGVIAFEDGFSNAPQRWLRAHRFTGASWVVENVADLSWLSNTCSPSGVSWSELPMVTAVDALGQPHILFASQPWIDSTAFEDHYRDAAGWHTRTFPITSGHPFTMLIDAAGTTHILTLARGFSAGTTRLAYLRIAAAAWQAAP